MKGGYAIPVLLMLLLSGFSFTAAVNTNDIIYVDDDGTADYTSIQDAIDAAVNGDTIYVHAGLYQPSTNLNVNKEITITGENKEEVFVERETGSEELSIQAKNVVISDISFINFRVSNQIQYDSFILTNNNFIINNDEDHWNPSLMHISGDNNEISYNTITFIGLEDSRKNPSMGIFIQCYQSTINNNIIEGKETDFIALEILDRTYWVDEELKGCNLIEGNTFRNNDYGIHLTPTLHPSYQSIITHNNFLNNTVHATFNIITPSLVDIFKNNVQRMIADSENTEANANSVGVFEGYWNDNYWDDYEEKRIKMIPGSIQTDLIFNQFFLYSIPWISFDFHPANEPYDIEWE